jgi:hypothetical protein
MLKIYGIIVVYNKNVENSLTYQCLKKQKDLHIVVCDNSTKDYGNQTNVEADGFYYVDMHGNAGLSRAYNAALNLISEVNEGMSGYVALFDDDTHIPDIYFSKLREEIQAKKSDIYLPIVRDEIGILSPSIMKKYYCHRAPKNVWSIKPKELCGINSGMAIRLKIFKNYRYNENIFLDYVDHNFLRDMRKKHKKVSIMDVEIRQTFSSNTDSKEKSIARFKIFKKDINEFYREGIGNRLFFYYVITRRKLQLTRKFRDLRMMFQ